MKMFTVRETQIVEYAATFVAESEEQAIEMFMSGARPEDEASNVVDSHGLTADEVVA